MPLFNRQKDDPMAEGIEESEDESTSDEKQAEFDSVMEKITETRHREDALRYALSLSNGLTTSAAQLVKDAKTIQKFLWEE